MFSLFLTNKDNKDLSSRFLNAHTSLENNEIKSINPRFKIASWGPQDSIQTHKFDNILIAIDGYCFCGNTLVNPSFVYKQVKNGDLDVKSLNGSFNIVIYDLLSNKLQLFTDKFGTRALFYNEIPSGIIISSRLNIITKCFSKGLQINSNSLAEYMYFGAFIQNGKTLFKSIFLLKSATELIFKHELLISQYWLPRANYKRTIKNNVNDFEDFYEEFKEIWRSVFNRLLLVNPPSKSKLVPLSAGYDSRAILSELSRRDIKPVTAFTISTSPSFEANTAKLIAEACDINHIQKTFSTEVFNDDYEIDKGVNLSDGMIFGTPYISNNLYEQMTQYGSQIFSGFGGDPIMGSHTVIHPDENSPSLLDYCFNKYSSLMPDEEIILKDILNKKTIKYEMEKSIKPFSNLDLTHGFDSWYMVNRNRYVTQMGVMSNRDSFNFILPFMDTELFNFINSMNISGRINREYFVKSMLRMYPDSFSIRSSVKPPMLYRGKYYTFKALNRIFPKNFIYYMQYKLDFNMILKQDRSYANYCMDAALNLEDLGLFSKGSATQIVKNNINGQKRYEVVDRIISLNEIYKNYL